MYATCPYRYFMRYALNIDPVEEPENIERIDHLQRGSLIHDILQKFLVAIGRDDPPRAEARSAHLSLLLKIAREEEDERVRRGVTGRPLVWSMDQRVIEEDLVRWYDAEVKDAESSGVLPGGYEVRFGPAGGFGEEDAALSTDEPLVIDVDGRNMRLQGRIDRIDWAEGDGPFRVIDYKTGRRRPGVKDFLKGGTMLQLPVYLRAAAKLLARDPRDGAAQYFFVSSAGGFRRHVVSGEASIAADGSLRHILGTIADGTDNGYFAPRPEDGKCRFCDYRDVCDAQIEKIMEPKLDQDPRAQAFVELANIQ
jgi:ATP-dependent helicase/DNAse subunit B